MPRAKRAKAKLLYVEKGFAPAITDTPQATDWRDPNFKPADDDQSLEARMWRLAQHKANT